MNLKILVLNLCCLFFSINAYSLQIDDLRVSRWIQNKECNQALNQKSFLNYQQFRLLEIKEEYLNALVTDDIRIDRKLRRSWNPKDWDAVVSPLNHKLQNPELYGQLKKALDQTAADPDLNSFLDHYSKEMSIISYFYKNESAPQVRLISQLDQIALLLENANIFVSELSQNIAVDYIETIALAWGDEPREAWPSFIKENYHNNPGTSPKTLFQAITEIQESFNEASNFLIGLPKRPDCPQLADSNDTNEVQLYETSEPQASAPVEPNQINYELSKKLYNLRYLIPILSQMFLQNTTQPKSDLKMIRNFLFRIYSATNIPNKQNFEFIFDALKTGWHRNQTLLRISGQK